MKTVWTIVGVALIVVVGWWLFGILFGVLGFALGLVGDLIRIGLVVLLGIGAFIVLQKALDSRE